jgi:Tetracyclin repressor-like, C-terminal domain
VASQVVGLGIARYVLCIEPLASTDGDDVVAAIGPGLQRYLTADLAPAER